MVSASRSNSGAAFAIDRVGFDIAEAVHGGNASGAPLFLGEQAAPADRDDRYPRRDGGGGYTGRRLPAEGLLVQRSLAGDDQVRVDQLPVEADEVEDKVDARPQPCAQQGDGREADAAGRPGSRVVP